MDNSEKWALAGIVFVLLVIVGAVGVHMVQEHQRQDRIREIGREYGDRLAWQMTH